MSVWESVASEQQAENAIEKVHHLFAYSLAGYVMFLY